MYQKNTATARMIYDNAVKIMVAAKLDPDNCKATQSDLVLEQQLLTTGNTFTFPVLNNQNGSQGNTIFNTEIRLTQQDSFIVSEWGFFLCKPTSATDTTFVPQTYPNPQVFTTGGVAAAAATIYNSYSRVTANNDVLFPVWQMWRHYLVPQTQQEPLIAGVENAIPYSQLDGTGDGFFPVEPNLIIVGSKNTVITLTLPAALTAVETFMRARMHFRGVLLQNSTIIT